MTWESISPQPLCFDCIKGRNCRRGRTLKRSLQLFKLSTVGKVLSHEKINLIGVFLFFQVSKQNLSFLLGRSNIYKTSGIRAAYRGQFILDCKLSVQRHIVFTYLKSTIKHIPITSPIIGSEQQAEG